MSPPRNRRSPSPRDKRDRSPPRDRRHRSPPRRDARLSEAELARQRESQFDRDQRTVFVSQMYPRASLRQIWEFFSQIGTVTDIQVIEDSRTRRSKGLAFVELASREMVAAALSLTGHLLAGHPVQVQITPAERNKVTDEVGAQAVSAPRATNRLHVTELPPEVDEHDLIEFFKLFGEVESIEVPVDSFSKARQGFAYVSYANLSDAKEAAEELDGIKILGRGMRIQVLGEGGRERERGRDRDRDFRDRGPARGGSRRKGDHGDYLPELDEDGGLKLNAQSRVALMQRLQRSSLAGSDYGQPKDPRIAQQQAPIARAEFVPSTRTATPCVVLKNLFDPDEEYQRNPNFDMEIESDVRNEAEKFGGLLHIFVDRDSRGNVFLRYTDPDSARRAIDAFHGRFFSSRQISADFVSEATYDIRFPHSRR